MSYVGFLISNFATGFDQERKPWLLPDDAQDVLLDGYVFRGVWQKRKGYSQFATGERGGAPYCESRMVHKIIAAVFGAGTGAQLVFAGVLAQTPVRRGTTVFTYTIGAVVFTATENGLGVITGTNLNSGASSINYTTGAVTLTFTLAPDNLTNITVTYDAHQGFPVMGVMNFYTQTQLQELIVADTTHVNRYNSTTNRLDDISPTTLLTGNNTNFFSWANYNNANDDQRLLFVNYKDPIQQYNGTSVSVYPVYTLSNQQTAVASGVLGNGTVGPYTINTPVNTGIVPFTLSVLDPTTPQTVTDNGFGVLQGNGTGTVNYLTGTIVVTFTLAVGVGNPINLTYKQLTTPIQTCLHVFSFQDRCVLLSTIENSGKRQGLRIRISGTGAFSDVFTDTDAIGAGFIDIPDSSFIQGADFNRSDLLIFTESSRSPMWSLRFTGNDAIPFTLTQVSNSRGSQSPYGTITYLGRTSATSARGLTITDGYTIERADNKIPEYSINEIDQSRFNQCFAGAVDEDRTHYLIHPTPNEEISNRILVTNYEEDNYAVYRIPLSCMGNFTGDFDTTWNDLSIYNTWDEMAAVYGNWNSFAYSEGSTFAIGGGHEGQIFKLNVAEVEDYPVKIRNVVITNSQTLTVTTDFQNYEVGDIISLEGMLGMSQANDKQAAIKVITNNFTFQLEINTVGFSAYTGSGIASKVINFQSKTKKFNPFIDQDKKVRCGWVYFYVSSSGTDLSVNRNISAATNSNPCVLTVLNHGYKTGDQIYINAVGGMTQLNGQFFFINVIDDNSFSLIGVNSTAFGVYTNGGFTSASQAAKMQVRVITNDLEQSTQIGTFNPAPYEVNLTDDQASQGIRKWYKIWVNQVGRFVQLEFSNIQSGAKIEIHAVMLGLAPIGRIT